ncbi:Protein kinase domain [Carpediemonas membranifera]|uniref:Protein kinase domain n=1 Tax=Carpediemonas membranifera TaxID=201153 RepID=A0A8J6B0F3_9EUKA|nr:Protein kinase domain [Carpediemonas membranifera]|eukprot:KAG9395745.1 Protein kinase domain [Carpediemonas membranifera]
MPQLAAQDEFFQSYDDENGHYMAAKGEVIYEERGGYMIDSLIATGTFGTVYRGHSLKGSEAYKKDVNSVAIKFIRSIQKYANAAEVEIEILSRLNNYDLPKRRRVTHLVDHFEFKKHIVMVFPCYGNSLLDFIKLNEHRGYNQEWTLEFTRSISHCMSYIHSQKIIHTDLKPENIVATSKTHRSNLRGKIFCYPVTAEVITIDLGSAIHAASDPDRRPPLVCTRQYRPPEVITGLAYDSSVDVWSLGCIVYELATGIPLFNTHRNTQHLAMVEKLLGPAPPLFMQRLQDRVRLTKLPAAECGIKYFNEAGVIAWHDRLTEAERVGLERAPSLAKLEETLPSAVVGVIRCCLTWLPENRVTMQDVAAILSASPPDPRMLAMASLVAETEGAYRTGQRAVAGAGTLMRHAAAIADLDPKLRRSKSRGSISR